MAGVRRKPRDYPKPVRHQNDQGKPATDRGKPPHSGGYSAKKKYTASPFKVYFEVSDPYTTKTKKVKSSWSAGKRRKSEKI
jgi:hypothetical protein